MQISKVSVEKDSFQRLLFQYAQFCIHCFASQLLIESVFVRNGEREAATSRNQPTEDFPALGPSTNQPSAPHAQMVKNFTG